jgi:CDP-glycerol glycerophosphotransferase (TagB/SpsB family)
LIITGNPYFDRFVIPVEKENNSDVVEILFISQPINRNGDYRSNNRIFENILDVVRKMDRKMRITIRLHPRDTFDAYSEYSGEDIIIDGKTDIENSIRNSDIIIGQHSTVLFEAVFRGKPVISYQPVEEKPDRLVTNQMGLSHLARTMAELGVMIEKTINKELITKKIDVFKYYNDGQCTRRVVEHIRYILFERENAF